MVCNKCNMQIADDSKFCGFCGNTIVNDAIQNSESQMSQNIPSIVNNGVNNVVDANVSNDLSNKPIDTNVSNDLNGINQESIVNDEVKQNNSVKISKIFIAITILLVGLGTIGFLIVNFLNKQ